jgi:hypothetical protein
MILRKGIFMKKKTLMSIVLLAIIGTSAVFAQQPTLDKLSFEPIGTTGYRVKAANDSISGAVVIPDTYNNIPVIEVAAGGFANTSITSVVIPSSLINLQSRAFEKCSKLTSVTFQLDSIKYIYNNGGFAPAESNLLAVYKLGRAGTYTRPTGVDKTWTKVDGAALCPTCGQPLPAGFKL